MRTSSVYMETRTGAPTSRTSTTSIPCKDDRDPGQFLTFLEGYLYPRNKRKRTGFVTKRDPIMVKVTMDKWYANLNSLGDHRYHSAKYW